MKSIRILSVALLCMGMSAFAVAQTQTESIKVSGNCGMCKTKIEKAAKTGGATYALWDKQTKILTVKYNSSSTNKAKIQQEVAAVGYDTPEYKATDEAYNKLDACCHYEREGQTAAATEHHMDMKMEGSCSEKCGDKCKKENGKCTDMAACKEKGCDKMESAAMNCADKCNEKCGDNCKKENGKCTDMAACKEKGCCSQEGEAMKCEMKDGKCAHGAECKEAGKHGKTGAKASCCNKSR
ncbi:MAG: hypothetical protein IPP73_01555 [Chitinophagaceae bacterium]|nr:hypothetical protein [Chitinophagaceae bacterium]